MKFIADLHIHSRFSRATSKTLNPELLSYWARKKGISVIGTGDFTHPAWFSELEEKLVEAEEGLYRLRPDIPEPADTLLPQSCSGNTRFLLSGEISCIYKKNGKTRKLHHLILMPDMSSARRLNDRLARAGNIASDGRPILGLDSRDLLEMTLEASERAIFYSCTYLDTMVFPVRVQIRIRLDRRVFRGPHRSHLCPGDRALFRSAYEPSDLCIGHISPCLQF